MLTHGYFGTYLSQLPQNNELVSWKLLVLFPPVRILCRECTSLLTMLHSVQLLPSQFVPSSYRRVISVFNISFALVSSLRTAFPLESRRARGKFQSVSRRKSLCFSNFDLIYWKAAFPVLPIPLIIRLFVRKIIHVITSDSCSKC